MGARPAMRCPIQIRRSACDSGRDSSSFNSVSPIVFHILFELNPRRRETISFADSTKVREPLQYAADICYIRLRIRERTMGLESNFEIVAGGAVL